MSRRVAVRFGVAAVMASLLGQPAAAFADLLTPSPLAQESARARRKEAATLVAPPFAFFGAADCPYVPPLDAAPAATRLDRACGESKAIPLQPRHKAPSSISLIMPVTAPGPRASCGALTRRRGLFVVRPLDPALGMGGSMGGFGIVGIWGDRGRALGPEPTIPFHRIDFVGCGVNFPVYAGDMPVAGMEVFPAARLLVVVHVAGRRYDGDSLLLGNAMVTTIHLDTLSSAR